MNLKSLKFVWGIPDTLFQAFLNSIVLVFSRIVGIEISYSELNSKRPPISRNKFATLDFTKMKKESSPKILSYLENLNKQEESRHDLIIDKAKTLLTVASLSFTLLLAFQNNLPKSFWTVVPLILVLIAVIVLLRLLSLRYVMFLKLKQSDIELEPDNFEKEHVKDLENCYISSTNSNDILADLFRTAQTYLIIGAIFIAGVFVVGNINQNHKKDVFTEKITAIAESVSNIQHLIMIDSLYCQNKYLLNMLSRIDTNLQLVVKQHIDTVDGKKAKH
jgi:hypothetical protein